MQNYLAPYDGRFDDEARKRMFGEALKQYRLKKKLKQIDICKMLNIKQNAYSLYENGKAQPTLETLVRLSYILDCSIDDLLQRANFVGDTNTQLSMLQQQMQEIDELLKDPKVQGDSHVRDTLLGVGKLVENLSALAEKMNKNK